VPVRVDVAAVRALGRDLKAVGDKQLKVEVIKAAQRATRDVKDEIKASAVETLPSSGGLGRWVAAITLRTRVAFGGRSVGVTIQGALDNKRAAKKSRSSGKRYKARRSGTFGARADLGAINRGRVMHPVYGRGPLQLQRVQEGFWTKPLEGETAEKARAEIVEAMLATARGIASRNG
jgi:hypothetical protein